jgi:hypothetical protein
MMEGWATESHGEESDATLNLPQKICAGLFGNRCPGADGGLHGLGRT